MKEQRRKESQHASSELDLNQSESDEPLIEGTVEVAIEEIAGKIQSKDDLYHILSKDCKLPPSWISNPASFRSILLTQVEPRSNEVPKSCFLSTQEGKPLPSSTARI